MKAKIQSVFDINLNPKNQGGYQSIAQKSLHFKNTLLRDQLMKLVMLREDDCNLAMFVHNLTDFQVLLNTLTHITTLFFQTSFAQTDQCKTVKFVEWLHGF